jgi:small Trp-rich protein
MMGVDSGSQRKCYKLQEKAMYMLGLGVVLLAMKYFEIWIVANWAWWQVFIPFGLAIAWWAWADASGYTKRMAMEREDARKQARIDKNKEAIGTLNSKRRR